MISIKTSDSNDIEFSIVKEIDYVAQKLTHKIASFQNDYFLNKKHGTDWISLFGKPVSYRNIHARIRSLIIETSEVTKIVRLDMSMDTETRKLIIDFKCDTIYGVISKGVVI